MTVWAQTMQVVFSDEANRLYHSGKKPRVLFAA
jgi:hypothetical protein